MPAVEEQHARNREPACTIERGDMRDRSTASLAVHRGSLLNDGRATN